MRSWESRISKSGTQLPWRCIYSIRDPTDLSRGYSEVCSSRSIKRHIPLPWYRGLAKLVTHNHRSATTLYNFLYPVVQRRMEKKSNSLNSTDQYVRCHDCNLQTRLHWSLLEWRHTMAYTDHTTARNLEYWAACWWNYGSLVRLTAYSCNSEPPLFLLFHNAELMFTWSPPPTP